MKLKFYRIYLLRIEQHRAQIGGVYIRTKCVPGGHLSPEELEGHRLHRPHKSQYRFKKL